MRLGLVIDTDTCVGCHACATACKQWNTSGTTGPLADTQAYGGDPQGVWFNRVRTYEAEADATHPSGQTVHFPMSCMHCEDADCVSVCPTGASYKRAEDGIVLIDQDKCMGCNLCAWACPYGARELDVESKTMKKCTLCIDRIYDEQLPEAERQPACVLTCPTSSRIFGDFDDPDSKVSRLVRDRNGKGLMPELGYRPTNQYLPKRAPAAAAATSGVPDTSETLSDKVQRWINKLIPRAGA